MTNGIRFKTAPDRFDPFVKPASTDFETIHKLIK
jgi:hypothetical protein